MRTTIGFLRGTLAMAAVALPLAAQTRESLLAADAGLSRAVRNTGLVRAIRPAFADDAAFLYPGAPVVVGRASIESLLGAQPILDSLTVHWASIDGWVSGAGDFGVSFGTSTIAKLAPAGGESHAGTYIAGWRREADRWRLVGLVLNGIVPPGRTVIPVGVGPVELPSIAETGPAAAMVRADLDFSAMAGKVGAPEAFHAFAAPEAIMIFGGEPRRGPDAIKASLASGAQSDWSWYPVVARAAAAGDLGLTIGQAIIRPKGGGEAVYSKYLTVWRSLNGTVRFLTDGGNPRPKP